MSDRSHGKILGGHEWSSTTRAPRHSIHPERPAIRRATCSSLLAVVLHGNSRCRVAFDASLLVNQRGSPLEPLLCHVLFTNDAQINDVG